MAEVCVIKSFRITPDLEYKIKDMKELSGLSESEILRESLKGIKIVREKPSKELMVALSKVNNIGNNINKIAKHANTFDDVDWENIMICVANLNCVANEIRKKFL